MTSDLLTFPIRFGLRAASVAVRTGLQASERAIAVASFVVKRASASGSRADGGAQGPAAEHRAAAQEERTPVAISHERTNGYAETPPPPAPRESAPAPSLPRSEPAHVSEEPTLVEEFAEPGAEDGAGAQVNVAEPWDGYAHMNAKDVLARLPDANAAELAAVQLYEAAHRSRETVMTAVKRELRAKSGRGAATAADQTRKEHSNGG